MSERNFYIVDQKHEKVMSKKSKLSSSSVRSREGLKFSNSHPSKSSKLQQVAKNSSGRAVLKKSQSKPLHGSTLNKNIVRVVHLGGLDEIGKNMVCFECKNDMIIVDCGMGFPDVDMLGVDLVLPDYSYVEKNISKLRALIITHGHEDHIGGVPYFLKRFNVPIYATRLTIGLIEEKLKEHGILKNAKLNVCTPRKLFKFGCFSIEMIGVNHSIPDAVGLAINTPAGTIVHTGDFKIDYSPIDGCVIDLARFSEIGSKGVLLLMADSTNAERPGHTMPERQVGESFQKLFHQAGDRRIIVASFSSNIHRIQQIINNAVKYGRHVAVSGRSMENVVEKAVELGYLNLPKGVLLSMDAISRQPRNKVIIITTGSQGEPMSALSRMANGNHKNVSISSEDFIIISASPIPGNEKLVTNVVNDLMKLGAKVIYEKMYEVHTSGHACQNELKTMIMLVKPKFFMPVHGEYKQLKAHADLAISMGVAPKNIIISEIGKVVEVSARFAKIKETVPSGCVFVDGLGVGDVGSVVLRDRKILSQDGLMIIVAVVDQETLQLISGPEIISRGFVYVRESERLLSEIRRQVNSVFNKLFENNINDCSVYKTKIKDEISNFIFKKTRRSPMILPIVLEV